jgi:hypothetical protein
VTMVSVGAFRQFVSFAGARTDIFKMLIGGAWFPKTRQGCQEPTWLEDGGTTGDPRQTRIYCECGASLSLNDLFLPGRLGQCRAEWPWVDGGMRINEPDSFQPSGCHDERPERGNRLIVGG